jgi:uncharacterized protein YkwD
MQLSTCIRTGFAAVLIVFALVPAAGAAPTGTTLSTTERTLLASINDVRAAHKLRPLRVDPSLVRAARAYSSTLIGRNIFTHGDLGTRLASHGVRGPLYGENLAWGKGENATPRGIVAGWLRSPGHRANLLRPGWTRIGLGARVGTFRGYSGATVVTADFAGT